MSVVMLFVFPIGLAFFLHERKDRPRYQAIFDTFFEEVRSNPSLSNHEKIEHVQKMMLLNVYHITEKSDASIQAERKIMSVGMLLMTLGFFYVGAALYLAYFYFLQKPHKLEFKL